MERCSDPILRRFEGLYGLPQNRPGVATRISSFFARGDARLDTGLVEAFTLYRNCQARDVWSQSGMYEAFTAGVSRDTG
jgi:hypothetical protein